MLRKIRSAGLLLILLGSLFSAEKIKAQEKPEEELGWKLGAQAYTFKEFSFSEALAKIKQSGLTYVEAYPGQTIGGGIEGKLDVNISAEKQEQVRELLRKNGIKLVSFGVVSVDNENAWEKTFEFAVAMDIPTITAEPLPEHIPFIAALAKKHEIKVAIHNHPKPTRYWDPETVLEALDRGNEWMGACADIGHWVRSGIDPVQALKKYEGRLIQLHFKDLNEFGVLTAHDVPWGTGASKITAVMRELKRQGFQGLFSVEYEYHWNNNVPEIIQSVNFFRETAAALKKEK